MSNLLRGEVARRNLGIIDIATYLRMHDWERLEYPSRDVAADILHARGVPGDPLGGRKLTATGAVVLILWGIVYDRRSRIARSSISTMRSFGRPTNDFTSMS